MNGLTCDMKCWRRSTYECCKLCIEHEECDRLCEHACEGDLCKHLFSENNKGCDVG